MSPSLTIKAGETSPLRIALAMAAQRPFPTRNAPRIRRHPLALAFLLARSAPLALLLTAVVPVAHAQQAAIVFDVSAGPLDQALLSFGRQAGLGISVDASLTRDLRSDGLKGSFTPQAGAALLLTGTGLEASQQGQNLIVHASRTSAHTTDVLRVGGDLGTGRGQERDLQGRDDVYDLDISTSYIDRATIERFKGKTPSDLVNGIPGVFSGDARNSGALDLNIRGIQGPGRVPVTIDGTEQALTVWRGYNGASNRNYIDPFLIGGIQILKGPSLTRNVTTGVGGAMVVNTLDVEDILDEGQAFGAELRLEGSSNAVKPRLPTLHTGEDYRTLDGFPQQTPNIPYTDRTLMFQPRSGGGGVNVFSGQDYAYRLALGWRATENLDLLAAYSYRERGNYFSGKRGADYYSNDRSNNADDYILSMANYWLPGNEVANTSSQMESWLFKSTWRITPDQVLQLGYRSSLSHYGEVMPSRIIESEDRAAIQWPLSRVDTQAWNAEYKWQPQNSRVIDLYVNVWRTDTQSDTYTAGGFPNYAQGPNAPLLKNTALANGNNARNGITLSNKLRLTDQLDLTVGGSFQHEKLTSTDEYFGVSDGWRMYPRAGRREEWQGNFNFEWRPIEALSLSAGARYSSYWAFDDFLDAHQGDIRQAVTTGYTTRYSTTATYTQAEREALVEDQLASNRELLDLEIITQEEYDEIASLILADVPTTYAVDHQGAWEPDANGNFTKAGNACLNGSLDADPAAQGQICQTSAVSDVTDVAAKKRKDHGWTPFYSATFYLSDYSRAYVRYGETLRYPSMFESTIAFSASLNPEGVEPEHAYNWEVGYVHDLAHLLSADTVADIKLSYYKNKTRDVIERDPSFKFRNIDKQTIEGVEFQGRYDSGRVFADLAINYNFKNEVCDEQTAALLSGTNGYVIGSGVIVPNCVDYGFVGGYLLTQSAPEFSTSISLGGRFMDQRLELGTRLSYYKQYENADLEWFKDNSIQSGNGRLVYTFNVPFSWGRTTLVDAYVSYKLRPNLSMELTGTNLTDRYYVDPATRSAMAAPGRTIKLSFTGRF
ncbi:hemoglobin/transferrin/lactoferrin receptor protein [Xanthomonas arboricola]|uniref:TonB-dependent receptor n=1 Tax=Xanthomonas euroxanthea TaxID=2259622 RepID=UPI001FB9C578|nr:TonB-dependent receptor [Xanthomonas euroxanthea]NIK41343.1 hemoglobin/transferrin/lactoferrin receptor protein [Xanthomonas euroxanthea]